MAKRKTAKPAAPAAETPVELPEWINPERWQAFEAMRKKIKKPMTKNAQKLLVRSLERLRQMGHEPNLVLEQAEFHNWQAVYPLKDNWLHMVGKNRDGTDRPLHAATAGSGSGAFDDY